MHALILSLALISPLLGKVAHGPMLVTLLNAASAVADVESTQHCLAANTCHEGNPLMPSNRAGAYGLTLGLVAGESVFSFKAHKDGSRHWWWIVPVLSIGVHAGAATSNAVRF